MKSMSRDTDIDAAISCSETVTGSHEFKITGYSFHKGLGANRYIESKNFVVGGYEWTIRFYPNGWYAEDSDISLTIALKSDGTNIRAWYELMLADQSGKNQHKIVKGRPILFERPGSSKGVHKVFNRSLLDNSDYIKDDCLLIRGRIGVVIATTKYPKIHNATIPPSNICQQIGQLLETGEGADIRFKVGRETFVAHKFVLVLRSPVFKAQLAGPMKDSDTVECIEIVDMEAAVFKAFLHFIYWDALPDLECLFAQHLFEAADRYGIERLRLICEAKLCEGVTIDTAATTLALAEQHQCLQLKSACLEFIAEPNNLEDVMQTEGFTHLQSSCPSVIRELLRYTARVGEHSVARGASASQV